MKQEQSNSPKVEAKEKKAKKKSNYYVDPVQFKNLILEYYETDVFTEELGDMVNKISEHVSYMPNFINYTYKDDMISDSNFKMVKALNQKKYDPTRGNPFSYFTKICSRSFINVIKKEKRLEDTIGRYQTEMYDELSLTGLNIAGRDTMEENNEY